MMPSPFDDIERMVDRMTRQFDTLEDDILEGSVPVDVEDAGDAYVVTADLPGYEQDDIDVELAGDRLTVSATHTESGETGDDGTFIRRERRRRSVNRSVRLPEAVDDEAAEAQYNNGVLTVRLPKAGDAGRDIPIN